VRRALLALAIALPVGLLLADPETRPTPKRERLEWGLYQIHWGRRFEGILAAELKKYAGRPDYVMFYRDLGRRYPRRSIDAIREHGATPIVSLELWHWMGGRKDAALPKIAKGDYDGFFREWAQAAARDGKRVLLRFGFEMNGDWFTWSGNPGLFKQAWRRIHAIFVAEKAANVEWIWSPNVQSAPDTPENGMHLYYPGADVVDWVALDGYNFGDDHDEWHKWESFESVFAKVLPEFKKRYAGKPVMIAETGCPPGGGDQRVTWIREAYAHLQGCPQVKAVVWFNYDKRREGEPNWRIDVTPESLAAFNETFARPR